MLPVENVELQALSYYCEMVLHTVGVKWLTVTSLSCELREAADDARQ
jgi:hypothetical protein